VGTYPDTPVKPILVLSLCLAVLLGGCIITPPQPAATTLSGKPEVLVLTQDVGAIKSRLIGDLVNDGYAIERDTEFSLVMMRRATTTESAALSFLAIGSSYSKTERVVSFTFVRLPEGIRVIAANDIRAHLIGGRVATVPMTSNEVHAVYQTTLKKVKAQIEGGSNPYDSPLLRESRVKSK